MLLEDVGLQHTLEVGSVLHGLWGLDLSIAGLDFEFRVAGSGVRIQRSWFFAVSGSNTVDDINPALA